MSGWQYPGKLIPMSIGLLLLSSGVASAASETVGPLTCWTASHRIEMRDCVAQDTDGSGTFGRCTIITSANGKRVVTRLVGIIRQWGGVHPIHKPKRALQVTYDRGNFTCRFTPSSEFVIGDCVAGSSRATCTVIKSTNGSRQYFKATATARPD